MEPAKDIMEQPEDEDSVSSEASGGSGGDATETRGETRVLGLTRWVQYVFVVSAAFFFWFFDKATNLIWQNFAEPNRLAISVASFVLAGVLTQRLYRNDRVHRVVTEIVGELAKVSWPSAAETRASTIIVIITSLIAAAIVGGFDFGWSFITDLLYKHKV